MLFCQNIHENKIISTAVFKTGIGGGGGWLSVGHYLIKTVMLERGKIFNQKQNEQLFTVWVKKKKR